MLLALQVIYFMTVIIIETPETMNRDKDREYLIYYTRPAYPFVTCRTGGGGGEETNQVKNSFNCLTILLKEATPTMNPWFTEV